MNKVLLATVLFIALATSASADLLRQDYSSGTTQIIFADACYPDTDSCYGREYSSSFVANGTYNVTVVQVELQAFGTPFSGNVWVELRNGTNGAGSLISTSSSVDVSTISGSFTMVNFSFSSAPLISNGENYTIVLNSNSARYLEVMGYLILRRGNAESGYNLYEYCDGCGGPAQWILNSANDKFNFRVYSSTPLGGAAPTNLSDGLLRDYGFDSQADPMNDYVTNTTDGVSYATWVSKGVFGGGLNFTGFEYASIPINSDIAFTNESDFTISFYAKTACPLSDCFVFYSYNTILSAGSSYFNIAPVNASWGFSGSGGGRLNWNSGFYADDVWHNYVIDMEFNGVNQTSRLFVDGAEVVSEQIDYDNLLGSIFDVGDYLILGNNEDVPLSGTLDNFCIWNRSLAQAEVDVLASRYGYVNCDGSPARAARPISVPDTYFVNWNFEDNYNSTGSEVLMFVPNLGNFGAYSIFSTNAQEGTYSLLVSAGSGSGLIVDSMSMLSPTNITMTGWIANISQNDYTAWGVSNNFGSDEVGVAFSNESISMYMGAVLGVSQLVRPINIDDGWHYYKVFFQPSTDEMNVYVDDVLLTSTPTTNTTVGVFSFTEGMEVIGVGPPSYGVIYFDNFSVTAEYAPEYAPAVTNISIHPVLNISSTEVRDDQDATVIYDFSGSPDVSLVNWYVDGSLVVSGNNTIGRSLYAVGQNLTTEVTPYDGVSYGVAVNASVIVSPVIIDTYIYGASFTSFTSACHSGGYVYKYNESSGTPIWTSPCIVDMTHSVNSFVWQIEEYNGDAIVSSIGMMARINGTDGSIVWNTGILVSGAIVGVPVSDYERGLIWVARVGTTSAIYGYNASTGVIVSTIIVSPSWSACNGNPCMPEIALLRNYNGSLILLPKGVREMDLSNGSILYTYEVGTKSTFAGGTYPNSFDGRVVLVNSATPTAVSNDVTAYNRSSGGVASMLWNVTYGTSIYQLKARMSDYLTYFAYATTGRVRVLNMSDGSLLHDISTSAVYTQVDVNEEGEFLAGGSYYENDGSLRFSFGASRAAVMFVPASVPSSDFVADVTNGSPSLSVRFMDLSSNNPTSWAWDFENDGIIDSRLQDPIHSFVSGGNYTVNLTVTNAGGSSEEVKSNYITVSLVPPVAGFSANVTSSICQGLVYPNEKDLPAPSVIQFNFSVSVFPDFNNDSYYAAIQRVGDAAKVAVCSYTAINSTNRNYVCNVSMNYYAKPGLYTIIINYMNYGLQQNYTNSGVCNYGQMISQHINNPVLTFTGAGPNILNIQSSAPIVVENWANGEFDVYMTATDLTGRQTPGSKLPASAFKAGTDLGSAVTLSNGVSRDTSVSVPAGLNSNASVYLWLSMPLNTVPQDYYSQNAWQVSTS